MKQHRVFMIGWEYPPHNSGGLGVACQGMTEALSRQNTQMYFTLPTDTQVDHMEVLNCTHSDWSGLDAKKPPFVGYASSVRALNRNLSFDSTIISTLPQSEMELKVDQYSELVTERAVELQDDYDIIHAHDWMSYPAAIASKKYTNKPFVAHIHSTEFDRVPLGGGSQYILKTEYDGMHAADRIIAVSHYTKKILVEKYYLDPNKIDVVHNGITPLENYQISQQLFAKQSPVIVFMGRLTMQKGTQYFLELAKTVTQKLPRALFLVAGNGDMYHELLLKTAHNGLTAKVLFSGFVRSKQRDALLDRADVFVMPSLSEPFGLVALEAAQRDTPVLLSKTSGVSEVLSGSIVVDFWDVDKMSEHIVALCTDQVTRNEIITQQHKDLKQYDWQAATKGIFSTYAKVST